MLPRDFYKSTQGIVFSPAEFRFQVSADSDNPTGTPVEFGNINPKFPYMFEPFSPQRLFTTDGNFTDVSFFVPGSNIPATVKGFGAVFSDVDLAYLSRIEFFDQRNAYLGDFLVPSPWPGPFDETFSFLGVLIPDENIFRVRILSGNSGPVEDLPMIDKVVMDDFIFAQPQPIPLPGTFLLMGTGLAGFWLRRYFANN